MFSQAGYRALVDGAGLLDRTDRGRLLLTGADRRSYLQGILTNDILALAPGTGCYAAMLTPQGRMITDLRVLELGDSVLLDLNAPLAPSLRERLDQFIFSEDVSVADVSGTLAQVGLYGPRAASILSSILARPAAAALALEALGPFQNVRCDAGARSVTVARSDDFGVDGFEIFVDGAGARALTDALVGAGALAVDHATADVCRIEAGRPLFGVDMDETTIPLEAGIEDRAISQSKGCYVGQEIIVRVLHRGHGRVARRLVGLLVDGAVPRAGDRIRAGEREAGVVTSATHSPALDRPIALGYVHRDYAETGTTLSIAGERGDMSASVGTLPFVRRQAEPARP